MKSKLVVLLVIVMIFSSLMVVNAETVLSLDNDEYVVGETVTVTFSNATGNESAWIAIYPEGKDYTEYTAEEKAWKYANNNSDETPGETAATEGTVTISTEGLAPGEYRVSYFVDGAYNEGAFANFTLVEASQNPPTSDSTVFMTAFAMLLMAAVVLKHKSVTSF
ncbi:MAG TPA: hypothetical protein PLI11_00765 [Clostridia bacterium]|nr:hypothetical protein [Clostridia bacterium]